MAGDFHLFRTPNLSSISNSIDTVEQFVAPMENRKSGTFPKACRWLQTDYQSRSPHREFRAYGADVPKKNVHTKVSLLWGFDIGIDKHSFCTYIPRNTMTSLRDSFIHPLEIHECADTITGVVSALQTALFLSNTCRRSVAPRTRFFSQPNPFPLGSQRVFRQAFEGKMRTDS